MIISESLTLYAPLTFCNNIMKLLLYSYILTNANLSITKEATSTIAVECSRSVRADCISIAVVLSIFTLMNI